MKTKLFAGLSFLILPSVETPRVQFLVRLIEANGGACLNTYFKDAVVLLNDTFVAEHGLRKSQLFHSEWAYDEELWYDLLSDEKLCIYKLSWISECLKHQKLLDREPFRTHLFDEHPEYESSSNPHTAPTKAEKPDQQKAVKDQASTVSSLKKRTLAEESEQERDATKAAKKVSSTNVREKTNSALILALEQLSRKNRLRGDTYRARSYQLAQQAVEKHDKPIRSEQEALALPNIGPSIAAKIQMILELGSLPGLHEANKNEELLEYFMACHGVGAQTAKKWVSNAIGSFREALEVYPSDFNWNVLFGLRFYEDWVLKIPREECTEHLALIERALKEVDTNARIVLTGSYRRGAATCGDIDTVLFKPGCDSIAELSQILEKLVLSLKRTNYIRCPLNVNYNLGQEFKSMIEELSRAAGLEESFSLGPKELLKKFYFGGRLPPSSAGQPMLNSKEPYTLKKEDLFMIEPSSCQRCRRVDILLSRWSQLGAVMIYFTGNDDFNKSLRLRATQRGWKLSNNGLYQANANTGNEGMLIESFDEKRIMNLLDVKWVPPEDRNVEGYI
ncbi:LAFA_0G15676g1_1 [Lachancea sp. 'fantastica']|nr:LAFA_0G15676g1_1 [Lachancea sp. 'fantastica']